MYGLRVQGGAGAKALWPDHQLFVVAAIAVFLAQLGLIAALLAQHQRRRRLPSAPCSAPKRVTLPSSARSPI